MFLFGMLLAILGSVLATLVFCLIDNNDPANSLGALYWVALLMVLGGGYALYPVSA